MEMGGNGNVESHSRTSLFWTSVARFTAFILYCHLPWITVSNIVPKYGIVGSKRHTRHIIGHFEDDFTGQTIQPTARHSTEGRWSVYQFEGQSHQAQLTERQRKQCKQKINIYIAPWRPKTQRRYEDGELNQARSKARYSRPTCKNCPYVCAPLCKQSCNIETVFINIILPLDQRQVQAKWR